MFSKSTVPIDATVMRDPEQLSGDIDGKVVMLSIANGEYYNMNSVGSRVWELTEKAITVKALLTQLGDEFEVAPDVCEREVLGFLGRLASDKLIRVTPAA
jgi:hypothetical protein